LNYKRQKLSTELKIIQKTSERLNVQIQTNTNLNKIKEIAVNELEMEFPESIKYIYVQQ